MNDRRTEDPHSLTACMEEAVRVFRSVKAEARDWNVKIAIENHAGDMTARETLAVITASGRILWGRVWIRAIRCG